MIENFNNYAEAIAEIHKHEREALELLFSELKGKEIEPKDITIMRGVGNPSAIHFLVTNSCNGTNYNFNARYYSYSPRKYAGSTRPSLTPLKKDYVSYRFLGSLGTLGIPKVVFLKEAPNLLFTEHISGQTLKEAYDRELKKEIRGRGLQAEFIKNKILSLIKSYAALQSEATKKSEFISEQNKREFFYSRSVEEQARDYLTIVAGGKNVEEKVSLAYEELVNPAVRGVQVCHGDLSPDNIIITEADKIYIIDPELKLRNEFADLGSLIAYIGDLESYWDQFAESFKLSKSEHMIEQIGVSVKGTGSLENRLELLPEAAQAAYFSLYGNILHYSLRIIAKRMTLGNGPESYKDQISNIHVVLGQFRGNPEKFGFEQEDKEEIELIDCFFEHLYSPQKEPKPSFAMASQ